LMRILLFKRFESSVEAFRKTIEKLLRIHERFLNSLKEGIVPAGEEAQAILYETGDGEDRDLIDALRLVSRRYVTEDFDLDRLKKHIIHDIKIYKKLAKRIKPITPDKDAKLQTLLQRLRKKPLSIGKVLIFTQYADTASYLYENLNPDERRADIDVIFSGDKSKIRAVGRFAPKANPEYARPPGERELNLLIATDVLSEGLNLQDGDKIVNYDLHWNPVRLIQRFGRIDRIGSDHETIYAFNFLPETGIDRNLGLRQKLHNRIQEIHDTIGEDSIILDHTERLNEEAMYAIYEKKGQQLSLFEDEEEEFLDLNEAEEILRQLRRDKPEEYERIKNLRDGIRAAKASSSKGLYVFCRAGRYQQLFFVDQTDNIVSRDVPKILGVIKCGPEVPGKEIQKGYNAKVMKVKRAFAEEVLHREAERQHTISLTQGQRYVLRELRILFGQLVDEDETAQVNLLEKSFRGPITYAIIRELNTIRRNGIIGRTLLKLLGNLYLQHNMRDIMENSKFREEEDRVPKIICSEILT
jgi:superfamily II DNA/RNA helicase